MRREITIPMTLIEDRRVTRGQALKILILLHAGEGPSAELCATRLGLSRTNAFTCLRGLEALGLAEKRAVLRNGQAGTAWYPVAREATGGEV